MRRLGWVVRCESAEDLLRKVSETLEMLHVSYERIIMKTEHSIEHVGAVRATAARRPTDRASSPLL